MNQEQRQDENHVNQNNDVIATLFDKGPILVNENPLPTVSEFMKIKQQNMGKESRKKHIKAYLKNIRTAQQIKLTEETTQFLDQFIQKYSKNIDQFQIDQLFRFKDILSLLNHQSDNFFYFNYFQDKISQNILFADNLVQYLFKLTSQNMEISNNNRDIILTLIEIVSDVIQFIHNKELFIEKSILEKQLISKLLKYSEQDFNKETRIISNVVMLFSTLCEYSEEAAEYIILSKAFLEIQNKISNQQINVEFVMNFSNLSYTILSQKNLLTKYQSEIIYIVVSIEWIFNDAIKIIHFENNYYNEIAKNVYRCFKLIQCIPIYQNLMISPKCIKTLLNILCIDQSLQDEQQRQLKQKQNKYFQQLLLFIMINIYTADQNQVSDLILYIEQQEQLDQLVSILHNIQNPQSYNININLEIATFTIPLSLIISDAIFTSQYIHHLVILMEKQYKSVESIASILNLLMIMPYEKQQQELLENSNIIDIVLDLISQNIIGEDVKVKLVELLSLFLKYSEVNSSLKSETNMIIMDVQRLNGVQVLQQLFQSCKNNELVDLISQILDQYFR